MRSLLEIIISFLAVFGAWSLLKLLREALLFPKKVRTKVSAVVRESGAGDRRALEYVNYLRSERKIAPGWLIIRAKGDIIEYNESNEVTEGENGAEWKDSQRTENS